MNSSGTHCRARQRYARLIVEPYLGDSPNVFLLHSITVCIFLKFLRRDVNTVHTCPSPILYSQKLRHSTFHFETSQVWKDCISVLSTRHILAFMDITAVWCYHWVTVPYLLHLQCLEIRTKLGCSVELKFVVWPHKDLVISVVFYSS